MAHETAPTAAAIIRAKDAEVVRLTVLFAAVREVVMHEGGWCFDYETAEGKRLCDALRPLWHAALDPPDPPDAGVA